MSDLPLHIDPDKMTVSEFKKHLPELAAAGAGKVSKDKRFAGFFIANPDCLALVKDLETIAEAAKSLFEPTEDPSDAVWSNIANKLKKGNEGGNE